MGEGEPRDACKTETFLGFGTFARLCSPPIASSGSTCSLLFLPIRIFPACVFKNKIRKSLFDVAELQLMFDLMSRRTLSLSLSFLVDSATHGKMSLRPKKVTVLRQYNG